jgi:peptidoglycan/LPS O-acetylase OafA/YrhL
MVPPIVPAPRPSPPVEGQHIAFIHILRGVAALVVAWSHLSGFWLFLSGGSSALHDAWSDWIARPFHIVENGGQLGVIIFFLISGYIITHTSLCEDRLSYLVKRTFRIFPALAGALLVTWGLLHVLAWVDLPFRGFQGGPVVNWLKSVFLLDGFTSDRYMLPTAWTLVVEVMFYALVFGVIGLQHSRPLASTWIIAGVWVAMCLVCTNVAFLADHVSAGASYLVGFLLVGRLFYFVHVRLVNLLDAAILGGAVFFTVLLLLEARDPGYLLTPGGLPGYEPLTAFVTAIIIFLAMLRWAPRTAIQPFAFLGDISYSLYLLHLPVGFALLAVFDAADINQSLATLLAIAGSILASWISYLVVERPSQKLARRLVTKVRVRRAGRQVTPTAASAQPPGLTGSIVTRVISRRTLRPWPDRTISRFRRGRTRRRCRDD